jgi:hypothetical protein
LYNLNEQGQKWYKSIKPPEVGKLTFIKSPQTANPKILSLLPLSQIRKFLLCTSRQVANPQIFMIYPQISYFKSANRKKDWVRKSQIRKGPYMRKVRKFSTIVQEHWLQASFQPRGSFFSATFSSMFKNITSGS